MRVFQPEELERLLHEYRRGRLSRRRFVQALGQGGVVLAGSAALAACGPQPPAEAPAAKPAPAAAPSGRDRVVLVFNSAVTSMDPHNLTLREGIKLFYHMFD